MERAKRTVPPGWLLVVLVTEEELRDCSCGSAKEKAESVLEVLIVIEGQKCILKFFVFSSYSEQRSSLPFFVFLILLFFFF